MLSPRSDAVKCCQIPDGVLPFSTNMSRGIGQVERRIIKYFVEAHGGRWANIKTLAHAAYVSPYFYCGNDPKPTRAQLVAVRRALKRLEAKGYPLSVEVRLGATRGRPALVLWRGRQFRRGDPTRYLNELARRSRLLSLETGVSILRPSVTSPSTLQGSQSRPQ